MHIQKIRSFGVALAYFVLLSCQGKPRVDLARLTFRENAESIIQFDDRYLGGVNTVEAPLSFCLQAVRSSSFAFNGVALDGVDIVFQMRSDKIRRDTTLYQGGAMVDQERVENAAALQTVREKFGADSRIYAYRVGIKTKALQEALLRELTKLYGTGTKNPNTDRGLYWNLKAAQRFVFYEPDSRWLIVVDNTQLSKSCFWDPATGTVDFGGCDPERYQSALLK